MSLRTRLLAISLALVTVGLAVAGWATYLSLQSFLLDRVDQQVDTAALPALQALEHPPPTGPPLHQGSQPRHFLPPGIPVGTVAQLRNAQGQTVTFVARNQEGEPKGALAPPADLPSGRSDATVSGAGDYRFLKVDASALDQGPGGEHVSGTLVVGVPLQDLNSTLTRLVWIELAVGAATLAALAALGFWLVRLGLRPLTRMEETARAIAAGDLSQRIEEADPRTEVGRLGRTLNAMLAHIEGAFAERHAAEQRLRRFVADASHELQTPLTSVRGYAELFRRGMAQRPEDLEEAMGRIESEAVRMSALVDDMLLLARLDEDRALEREPVDLAVLAAEGVRDAKAVEPSRPITLETEGATVVRGDEARLRQVVANLLGNVRRHTPPGAAAHVRVARVGDEAVLEVADAGQGMSAEQTARVFERFFRADPSRARTSGGTGLGLSIVAAIASAHGGRAEVESEPGRGSTFRLVLPLLQALEPAGGPPESAEDHI
jgi:two-component system, OmpR family, sensor kinase